MTRPQPVTTARFILESTWEGWLRSAGVDASYANHGDDALIEQVNAERRILPPQDGGLLSCRTL